MRSLLPSWKIPFWIMAESTSESVWNCLNFSWITWCHSFLNYYWNSDEFSRYSKKFRFVFQKNSGLRFNCSGCWLKCLLNVSELWLNRLLNLSEFQLNHISELLLKFGRIQPIFRKIQICISENSGTYTFLNYYWNSDEFSQYSEKFRFVFQKNSDQKFMLIWILAESSSANIQKSSDLLFRTVQTENSCC